MRRHRGHLGTGRDRLQPHCPSQIFSDLYLQSSRPCRNLMAMIHSTVQPYKFLWSVTEYSTMFKYYSSFQTIYLTELRNCLYFFKKNIAWHDSRPIRSCLYDDVYSLCSNVFTLVLQLLESFCFKIVWTSLRYPHFYIYISYYCYSHFLGLCFHHYHNFQIKFFFIAATIALRPFLNASKKSYPKKYFPFFFG